MTLIITDAMIAQAICGLIILLIWDLIWKGIALWKSSRNGHKVWFIVILLTNTLGIIPIVYITMHGCKKKKKRSKK